MPSLANLAVPAQSPVHLDTPDDPLFDSEFLAKLEQLYLLSRKLFRNEERAERASRHLGGSLEFADYRNYVPGDDLRSIDWNIYGRLDRLFVKLFEAEQDLHIYLLIDASASMTWRPEGAKLSKFDQARRIAAALAYIGLANLDRVDVSWFSDVPLGEMGLVRGKAQFHRILRFLDQAPQSTAPTSLGQSLRNFAKRTRRPGLAIVLSDFFDPENPEAALGILQSHRFETFAVQILDPAEINPVVSGDLQLHEPESDGALDITVTPGLIERYRVQFQRAQERLSSFCRKRGIGFLSATTAMPFEDLVLRVLRGSTLVK